MRALRLLTHVTTTGSKKFLRRAQLPVRANCKWCFFRWMGCQNRLWIYCCCIDGRKNKQGKQLLVVRGACGDVSAVGRQCKYVLHFGQILGNRNIIASQAEESNTKQIKKILLFNHNPFCLSSDGCSLLFLFHPLGFVVLTVSIDPKVRPKNEGRSLPLGLVCWDHVTGRSQAPPFSVRSSCCPFNLQTTAKDPILVFYFLSPNVVGMVLWQQLCVERQR